MLRNLHRIRLRKWYVPYSVQTICTVHHHGHRVDGICEYICNMWVDKFYSTSIHTGAYSTYSFDDLAHMVYHSRHPKTLSLSYAVRPLIWRSLYPARFWVNVHKLCADHVGHIRRVQQRKLSGFWLRKCFDSMYQNLGKRDWKTSNI